MKAKANNRSFQKGNKNFIERNIQNIKKMEKKTRVRQVTVEKETRRMDISSSSFFGNSSTKKVQKVTSCSFVDPKFNSRNNKKQYLTSLNSSQKSGLPTPKSKDFKGNKVNNILPPKNGMGMLNNFTNRT